ncbi:NADH-dependent flavin oxidoreductase [Rummeliibacillus suwonensis]|uniref:NADH-dependent flavin oxidoreductase n=1 Tax=Rummeliibacillus suwonensis TaxID=1306154 RepID=UPI001AAF7555|nr:NADH-dependent flavin oxidoreductase [Rummeliibacillus suwonensis]
MMNLFESYTFSNGISLKNRVVMAPMTNYSSNADGTVSDSEVAYYARRSKGVGLVVTACTHVTENGKGFPGQFAGFSDQFIPSLKRVADAIHEGGAKAVLQIYHGGRRSIPEEVPNGEIVSASDVAFPGNATPRPLTIEEIKEIVKAYGETTRRAIEAGYDGVEIHGANTYLLQQFFSGYTNRRTDEYGGSLENRMRFPLEVVDEVKKAAEKYAKEPFIVGYRFSPEEEEETGITMDQTVKLIDALAGKELTYLHVSQGEFFTKPHRFSGDKNKTRVEILLDTIHGRTPLIGVGSIYSLEDAEKASESGIDLLALGRELLIEPDWVQKAEAGDHNIPTKIDKSKQKELVIPDPMWKMLHRPGWIPGM